MPEAFQQVGMEMGHTKWAQRDTAGLASGVCGVFSVLNGPVVLPPPPPSLTQCSQLGTNSHPLRHRRLPQVTQPRSNSRSFNPRLVKLS